MITQSEETKLTNLAAYAEYEKTQPIEPPLRTHCESCSSLIVVADRTMTSAECRNCGKEIDLR